MKLVRGETKGEGINIKEAYEVSSREKSGGRLISREGKGGGGSNGMGLGRDGSKGRDGFSNVSEGDYLGERGEGIRGIMLA